MQHPDLKKTLADFEYERRVNRLALPTVLSGLSPLLLGVITWWRCGAVSWVGVGCAAVTYAAVTAYAW